MNYLILLFIFNTSTTENLEQLKSFYQIPLNTEPSFIKKDKAYLNLSVIYIRLNELEKAMKLIKKASYFERKTEAAYLEGVIYYLKGDIEKATLKFKELNSWEYTTFLENLYSLPAKISLDEKIKNDLPDSLRFYFIFHEKDTSKILNQLNTSTLPLWQNFLGRGYLSYKREKYRRALNYFKESHKLRPAECTGIYIISTLFQLSEFDSLLSFQQKNSINTPLTNYIKGEALYKKGEIEKAMEVFLYDTNSEYRTHALFGAGWSKYNLTQYSESAKLFERFLSVYEGKELEQYALYRLARAQLKQGKTESLENFKKMATRYPDSPLKDDAYLLLGKINFLLNNYDEATKWLSLLTNELPLSRWTPNAYKYLGEIHKNKGDYKTAITYYKKILSVTWATPDLFDEARYNIEEIKWMQGKYSTKINMYKAFTNKYSKSRRTPSLLLAIGEYYHAAKRYDLAIQFNKKILTNHSEAEESNEALLFLVKIYREMGDRNAAIELLAKALKERPELNNEINLKLGEIHFEAGELRTAIEYYKEVSPNVYKPYTLYKIGFIYQELGLFKEARIPLQNIINDYESSEYFEKSFLLIAQTYMNEGSLKKAIEILNAGLKKLEKNKTGDILLFKADIYCEFKDEEALDLYLESLELTFDNNKKLKILEDGRKCAIRLNNYERAEIFENLMNELKSTNSKP